MERPRVIGWLYSKQKFRLGPGLRLNVYLIQQYIEEIRNLVQKTGVPAVVTLGGRRVLTIVRARPRKLGKSWLRQLRFFDTIPDSRKATRSWRKYEAKLRRARVKRRLTRRKGT